MIVYKGRLLKISKIENWSLSLPLQIATWPFIRCQFGCKLWLPLIQNHARHCFQAFCTPPVQFNLNLNRHPFLGQVADLDLLLCTGFNSEHAYLFLCHIFLKDQWMIEKLSKTMKKALVDNNFSPIPSKNSFHMIKRIDFSLPETVWGKKNISLDSNLASVADLKLHTVYAVISEAIKPLKLVGQVAEFKFESKFEPLPVIWQSLWRLFQKIIEGLGEKSTAKHLGASWGRSPALLARVGRVSTNTGRFQVCWSRCWLQQAHLRKTCYHLWYWLSSRVNKVLILCKFQAATSQIFWCVKWTIRWNWLEVVADQSSAHCFVQSFYQSVVSE